MVFLKWIYIGVIKLQAKITTMMENTGSCLASHTTTERLLAIANKQEEVKIIVYAFIDTSWIPGRAAMDL